MPILVQLRRKFITWLAYLALPYRRPIAIGNLPSTLEPTVATAVAAAGSWNDTEQRQNHLVRPNEDAQDPPGCRQLHPGQVGGPSQQGQQSPCRPLLDDWTEGPNAAQYGLRTCILPMLNHLLRAVPPSHAPSRRFKVARSHPTLSRIITRLERTSCGAPASVSHSQAQYGTPPTSAAIADQTANEIPPPSLSSARTGPNQSKRSRTSPTLTLPYLTLPYLTKLLRQQAAAQLGEQPLPDLHPLIFTIPYPLHADAELPPGATFQALAKRQVGLPAFNTGDLPQCPMCSKPHPDTEHLLGCQNLPSPQAPPRRHARCHSHPPPPRPRPQRAKPLPGCRACRRINPNADIPADLLITPPNAMPTVVDLRVTNYRSSAYSDKTRHYRDYRVTVLPAISSIYGETAVTKTSGAKKERPCWIASLAGICGRRRDRHPPPRCRPRPLERQRCSLGLDSLPTLITDTGSNSDRVSHCTTQPHTARAQARHTRVT
ncbi:hypothetical protein J8273_7126 [Carpediemonas membranifera]|uniref:Uncharacterized protein n=1 Tax=Carpediemonas membranifera TaxID=201153 RepID=A0A8J6E1N6_9EUKA|nr:hypothetical protein J8273_7126 [Carpediemonas membranifera]|eukprot:KAG9390862.1 hypothetical protein J8273_7126 [Carpediemonas membranifera]